MTHGHVATDCAAEDRDVVAVSAACDGEPEVLAQAFISRDIHRVYRKQNEKCVHVEGGQQEFENLVASQLLASRVDVDGGDVAQHSNREDEQ